MLSLKALSLPLSSFWFSWFPWLIDRYITLISGSTFTWHSPYVSASLCPNFSLLRTPVISDLGPTLSLYDIILTWLHLHWPYFQLKSYSQVPVDMNFAKTLFNPKKMWYLVLNKCYFLPFMIHSDQFSSQLTHCLPQELWGACHCIPLYVCPLLPRTICLLNNLVSPFLLLPENSHQGKPINGISFLFIFQIFTAPRLLKSRLMSSMASSDLPSGQDTKTQSVLGMNTVTV